MTCRSQVVTAGPGNTPIDISIPAVMLVIDALGIKDRMRALHQVRRLWFTLRKPSCE